MGKEYVVIGLGRFGGSIVRELNALDMDVMAIDHDENRVNEYSDIATHAVVADTTDEAVMKSLVSVTLIMSLWQLVKIFNQVR